MPGAEPVSAYAGSTLAASYPPPGATNPAINSYFPDPSQVGYSGPTPTGAEPDAIETASSYPKVTAAYPLSQPNAADNIGSFNVMKHWGNLSPMFSVESFGLPKASPLIPEECGINQVFFLTRHGARYPTSGSGPTDFAARIHAAASQSDFTVSGPLEFLATWTYNLGAEILTPFGRQQLFNSGVAFRNRYGRLLNAFTDLPVWRTTSEDRMVDSALNFAAGFFDIRSYQASYHQEIIVEANGFNNTLAPYETCTNANLDAIGNYGSAQAAKWAEVYLQSALSRLQPLITGYNLTITDLINMQSTCAYEVVALGSSKFCDLFTSAEWEGFEYHSGQYRFWYSDGPGNPTAAAQGLGYVQELIARLTQTPITVWNSTTNSTLDSSNITFPLYQPIFVDATHDVVIANILTALNFTSLAANGPLPTDHIPPNRSYIVSQIAPFAANLIAQVISCPAGKDPTHIRFILNDGILPMTGIKGCTEDPNGLCSLSSFISGMQERIGQIDFDFDCFANYTMPNPDNITDGRYPAWLRNN
ncbi:hypothetical protein PAXRUDRAFT_139439 [Paxillus rubicundulus Ve08.2h10]|uniref:Acid phosphatase n=1 Tax=Paxillus rubicundulus Ve08.2h10 TaxID=930991 RepID=A0A0D0DEP6_9AGAM|nr:hypothetical protein PAXRUDRAFT_139439 [Paxillus rubicundulus Ve08.2h10]